MPAAPNPSTGSQATAVGTDIVPIIPNDDTDLVTEARVIRCKPISGTAGTLRITTRQGVVRNTEIAVGGELQLYVTRVHLSGTTATGLEAII